MSERTAGWKWVLIRDLLIFKLKLILDGFKDLALIQIAIVAAIIDIVRDRGHAYCFYRVLRLSERFDLWLNLHGAALGAETDADGLFGRSVAGTDTLLGRLEEMLRGTAHEEGGRARAA